MQSDAFVRLQKWYLQNCDGDWEHSSGVRINTLDNPGWQISINTYGALVELNEQSRECIEHSEADWIHYWVDGGKFEAAGGPENLTQMIEVFFQLWDNACEQQSSDNSTDAGPKADRNFEFSRHHIDRKG